MKRCTVGYQTIPEMTDDGFFNGGGKLGERVSLGGDPTACRVIPRCHESPVFEIGFDDKNNSRFAAGISRHTTLMLTAAHFICNSNGSRA